MSAFTTLKAMFYSAVKLGTNGYTAETDGTIYNDVRNRSGQNGNVAADIVGSLFVNQTNLPSPYNDNTGRAAQTRYPLRSTWSYQPNANAHYIGLWTPTVTYRPCALYSLMVMGGNASVDWEGNPTWVQLFWPTLGVLPALNAVPKASFPLPRQPSMLNFNFGVSTPFYSSVLGANTGGIAIVLSSTRDNYAAPTILASFVSNWAFLGPTVTA